MESLSFGRYLNVDSILSQFIKALGIKTDRIEDVNKLVRIRYPEFDIEKIRNESELRKWVILARSI